MEGNHYAGLRRNILGGMLIIPAIPFTLLLLIGYFYFSTSLRSEINSKFNRIAEDHRQMIESFLNERKSDLKFVVDSYSFDELLNPETLTTVFDNLSTKSDAFTDLGVFNAEGVHVAYHGPYELAGKEYGDTPWFKEVLKNGFYISDVYLGYRQTPHFVIAVLEERHGRKWVLRATINTSLFRDLVEKIRIGKTGEAYIINDQGEFQTARRSGGELMSRDNDIQLPLNRQTGIQSFVRQDSSGDSYLTVRTWLTNTNWLLVVRQETSEAFEDVFRVAYLVLLVIVLGGLLIVSMAIYVTRRLINRLAQADTEKKELGQQLIIAGRLAEIGEMSAGFAHEINNPLQIIRSEQTLIDAIWGDLRERGDLKESEDTEQIEDCLKQIGHQVDRCAKITQGLLKFARKKESQVKSIPLSSFLPGALSLVEGRARSGGVTIHYPVSDNLPSVKADPAHLEQVVVNLLNNALDAVEERHGSSGGDVIVSVEIDADNRVAISIKDNGSGIRPEDLGKIFTPFFTTKPVGKGTGLGLPICYGIISEMGGEMDVKSGPGEGATFTVHLLQR